MELLLVFVLVLAANSAVGAGHSHHNSTDLKTRLMYGRIYNGVNATKGQFPYMVSLQVKESKLHWCGGSLLTMRHIITAAHCVQNSVGLEAVAGKHVMGIVEDDEQRRPIVKTHEHEDFRGNNWAYDLAVAKVWPDFVAGTWVGTICLPKMGAIPTGWARVAGWGAIEGYDLNPVPLVLQTTELEIRPAEDCLDTLPLGGSVDTCYICAASPSGAVVCRGDSGGPFVQDGVLIGVVKSGVARCGGLNKPSVFVDVAKFVDWIIGVVPELANQ